MLRNEAPSLFVCLTLAVVGIFAGWPAPAQDARGNLLKAEVADVLDGDTIKVRWTDQTHQVVRYLAVGAPERKDAFGEDAYQKNKALVSAKTLWIELERQDKGYRRDSRGRLLGYAFLDAEGKECVNVALVREGFVRIDIRDVTSDTSTIDFPVKYLDQLLPAQIAACKDRRGWWGNADPYQGSDIAIAFVKFWGTAETAYLVNRGKDPVNLADGWTLADRDERNKIELGGAEAPNKHILAPGGTCRVHTGRYDRQALAARDTLEINLFAKKRAVWNNVGDEARLLDKQGMSVYVYVYKGKGG